jgi:hypothetical protein
MDQTGVVPVIAAMAVLACGCGGAGDGGSGGLRDGVYEFELSREYLRLNGIPAEQARTESGVHRITIDRGSFIDRWRAADGTVGACAGVYSLDGNRAAFHWTSGCTGDWAMSYSSDGDRIRWSHIEPLDADAGPAEQKVTEVFNGVPWTRTGEEPKEGEQ